jgi:hypothetical protein
MLMVLLSSFYLIGVKSPAGARHLNRYGIRAT